MSSTSDIPAADSLGPPGRLFPLVRHLSWRATALLVRLPVTPNQVTFVSIVVGLAAAACFLQGGQAWQVLGAGLLVLNYVLDNSDGEIARIKDMYSDFGVRLDTFGDWAVHGALFVALGYGVEARTGQAVWMWLGWIAAAGGTINYVLGMILDARRPDYHEAKHVPPGTPVPQGLKERLVYAFRALARADFCFLLLALCLLDLAWLLLPAAAIGAQVYWITSFTKGARTHHV